MKRQGLLTDRMPLIEALERETGQKAVYCGAPSFKYTVGSNTVYRDGSLESDDTELIRKLEEDGLIEGITEAESISYPLDDFTGRSLVNLVNSLSAREKLLNKAADHPNAFHMSVGLVRELREQNPSTISEFMDVVFANGGEKAMRGLRITGSAISFPGFPDTPTFHALADLMVRAAVTQGWIKPVAKDSGNEKYSFRVWLNALGMKGAEYKTARAELLSHFEGDPSFRTEEQKIAYQKKVRKATPEPDFIPL